MKALNIFAVFCLMAIAAGSGYVFGTRSNTPPQPLSSEIAASYFPDENTKCDISKWQIADQEFLSISKKKIEHGCENDSGFDSCEEISIANKNGKNLFRLREFSISSMQFISPVPGGSAFLIMETNGGGTDENLVILAYRNKRVVEIIDQSETETRGGYWFMSEYRSGNQGPYFKPQQLFVLDLIGGADPNPSAAVFRYRDGMYKKAGEISMQELGDFIEQKLGGRK